MKLLVITQAVDSEDPILGFFHRWIEEFSHHFEKVTVVCLYKGTYNFPHHVEVLSLGKEEGVSRLKYILRFYSYIWSRRNGYDAVFVHMNPVYVVLGGTLWRLLGKRIMLWYTHRAVSVGLFLSVFLAHEIFTATPETFRIKSRKVRALGHGIDMTLFIKEKELKKNTGVPELLHVGRISSVKKIETVIQALDILRTTHRVNARLTLVGGPVSRGDIAYLERIKRMVAERRLGGCVVFKGSVPNAGIAKHYRGADITLNPSETGGIDKVALESMASGVPVLASNPALKHYFGHYTDRLLFDSRDPGELASRIAELLASKDRREIATYLKKRVAETSDLGVLIKKIAVIVKK